MTAPQTLLKAWNLQAKKELGQNFLKDPSTAEMILDRAGIGSPDQPTDTILEIGPGLGALTLPAARRVRQIHAVEADRDLVPILKAEALAAGCENIEILNRSILKVDMAPLLAEGRRTAVMGNLPYNISSQILVRLLAHRHRITHGVFMLQTEMADRITTPPGKKNYGRISAVLQYSGEIRKVCDVKAHLFFPKPKIDSTVIEIRFPENPQVVAKDDAVLFDVIRAAFSQRRKTLRNSLGGSLLPINPTGAATLLDAAGIEPTRRAETLTIPEFVTLSDTYMDLLDEIRKK